MDKKRVLIFAEYIGENHNSTAYYWSQIVKNLSDRYQVLLIAPENVHSLEFVEKYGISSRLVKYAKYNKNSLLSRLWGQMRQSMRFMAAIRREVKNCDLVFSGTNPIIAMGLMSVVVKIHKFKWLVLVHDVFPNNLVPARIVKPKGAVYGFLALLSRAMYAAPTHLISIGRDMKVLLADKTRRPDDITYIPNWASTDVIRPVPKKDNPVLQKLGWTESNTLVFQFFGNLGRLQGISNLLRAIDKTKSERARFLIIGDGSEQAYVIAEAEKINNLWGYKRVCYYGTISLADNTVGLNACDISLVTLSADMYGLGVPSKAYFSLAADKPILCVGDLGAELHQMVEEFPIGWFVEADKEDALAETIDLIADAPASSLRLKESPRNILQDHFSELRALDRIEQVVEKLV